MIAPIATAVSLLSRHSLALSLSSIPDPVRGKLDATVRHFSHLVALSTIAVALGVLMEGVELASAVVEWRKRKRREKRERIQWEELRQVVPVSEGKRKLPKSHSEELIWAKLILRVGLILVVIGVVGEWRYGAKLEGAHDAVHAYDLEKIEAADEKAGDAAASAKAAHGEADEAKASARAAVKDSGDALSKANLAKGVASSALNVARDASDETARLNQRSEELTKTLAGAQSQIEDLDVRREALEKSISPRPRLVVNMLDPSKPKTTDLLRPRVNVFLRYIPSTWNDAEQLRMIFGIAQWPVVKYEPADPNTFNFSNGVIIWATDEQSHMAAKALCDFLATDDWWDTMVRPGSTVPASPIFAPEGTILVQVGVRPQPYLTHPKWETDLEIQSEKHDKEAEKAGVPPRIVGCRSW